jgi:Kef-type K+ transport system membrane component KefB
MELEILFELAVIMVSAAVLGTLFLFLRQPIVIAYIAIGFALGPGGLGLIKETTHLEQIAHVGVILLLFLIGLNLQPQKLVAIFQKTALLTLSTSLLFALAATTFALLLQFSLFASLIVGAAMMFSSTVVGLKLVPTTTLHHKRTGEVMTGVLLLQDLLAILIILLLSGGGSEHPIMAFGLLLLKFIALAIALFLGVRWIMLPLLTRFDVVQEYTFVATLGWCLLGAEVAHLVGLSYEIGAFTAGISIASSPVALAIAEHLKPLREFFLILFFFAIGARLNLQISPLLLAAAIIFGTLLVPLKAFIFRKAFVWSGEKESASKELSVRLSQASEFSLLVVLAATSGDWLHYEQGMMIQIATLITFIFSTYWTVLRYPTPISASRDLLQD